jgi:DNA topoisomerase-1
MSYSVLIVESPEKARAIFSMLGSGWKVFATRGHICDLPEKQYGITQKDDEFQGKLVLKPHAKEVLQTIRQAITPDTPVYLATDDDFEGERIAHDVAIALKLTDFKRIVFSEISESAILEAIQNPRPLDIAKLNAQKARRLIDRITGYPGSHAIKKDFEQLGLPYDPQGIGRSIAPALKLLCEVEEAKQEFEDNPPEEAKMIRAKYNVDGLEFVGMLPGAYTANMYLEMEEKCNLLSRNKAVVSKVKPNSTHKAPPKPLTTSSYQYGMFYLYGIKPKEAMQIAQTLYNLGFISYPRTDSHRVPQEKAITYMDYILQHFGEEYCHDVTRCYEKDISEGAQNAHPALLPTKAIPTHYPDAIFDFWGKYERFRKLRENDKFLKAYHFIFYRAMIQVQAVLKGWPNT